MTPPIAETFQDSRDRRLQEFAGLPQDHPRRYHVTDESDIDFPKMLEQAVLAAMLMSDWAAKGLGRTLAREHFYTPAHRLIFAAVIRVLERGEPLDVLTLETELATTHDDFGRDHLQLAGGPDYLLEVCFYIPSAANAPWYGKALRRLEGQRRIALAQLLAMRGPTDEWTAEERGACRAGCGACAEVES